MSISCSSLQSRELAIVVVWKDQRQMCAVKFLRLEDFLYDHRREQAICLEPQGVLFADVCHFLCTYEQLDNRVGSRYRSDRRLL